MKKQNKDWEREFEEIEMPGELIDVAKSEVFWKWWVGKVKPFIRQLLAQKEKEVRKLKISVMEYGNWHGEEELKQVIEDIKKTAYADGWNDAVKKFNEKIEKYLKGGK